MQIRLQEGIPRIRDLMASHHLDEPERDWMEKLDAAFASDAREELFSLLGVGAARVGASDSELFGTMIGVMNGIHPEPEAWLTPR